MKWLHSIWIVALLLIGGTSTAWANGCSGSTFTMEWSPGCGCWQVCGNYISDCDRVVSLDFNFGDGTTGSGANVCHVYAQPGTYTVTMIVRAKCHGTIFGTPTRTCYIYNTVTVPPQQPAGITADYNSDSLCLGTVQFTDNSTNAGTWLWDFGDGTTSTQQNPSHNYSACGTYPVTLTITDGTCCPSTDVFTTSVTVNCPEIQVDTACWGEPTNFTPDAQGTLGATWDWQFSDGGTSTDANPAYVFSNCNDNAPVPNSVTVTASATSCSVTQTLPVTVLCGVEDIIETIDSTLCFGDANGSIAVTAVGDAPPIVFNWSTGPTGPAINNLSAGMYTVTATDADNCTATETYTVFQPDLFEGVVTVTDIDCYGWTSGSALLTATGGTPPYSYVWSDGQTTSGPPNSNIVNLPAGPYTVSATDVNGCSFTASGTVSQAPEITASFSTVNSSCGICDGSATVTGGGGSGGPYIYQWGNGTGNQTTATATGLCAGNYFVVVEDANVPTCSKTFTVNVSNIGAEAVTATATDVSCASSCDGTATLSLPSGCTNPPCTYAWFDSLGFSLGLTTASISNLCAGMYSVEVTNGINCKSYATVTVNQPPALMTSTSVVDETCPGDCDGSATVTATGGVPPFSYQWYDGNNAAISGATSATATNLCPGSYSVSITDNNNCVLSDNALIIGRNFSVTTTPTPITCYNACNGSIEGVVIGGAAPLSFQWLDGSNNPIPGQTARNIFTLCAGTYTLQVTDANNCVVTSTEVMNEPGPLTISASATDILCTPGCSSTGTAVVSGGTTPYTLTWLDTANTALGSTTTTINNLCAGDYTVEVADANGCPSTPAPFTVNNYYIVVDDSVTEISCPGADDGAIDLTPSGGTPPYTFNWAHGPMSEDLTGLGPGNYSVTVSNTNGCTVALSFSFSTPPPLTLNVTSPVGAGGYNVQCNGETGIAIAVGGGGTPPYTYQWDANASNQANDTAEFLLPGSYDVTATDDAGCTVSGSVSLNEAPPVDLNVLHQDPACFGDSTGLVLPVGSGGVPPYRYFWDSDTFFLFITDTSGLPAGTYIFAALDANDCDAFDTITVTTPPELIVTETHVDLVCFGDDDGSIDITVMGGTPPYQFSWNPAANTEDLTDLVGGTYDLTVTDDSGCVEMMSIIIDEPLPIPDSTIFVTICDNDNFQVGGNTIASSGVYVDSLLNPLGCDSVIYYDVTVNPTSSDTTYAEICEGETYLAGGSLQTQSGVYVDLYQNVFSCDSAIVTVLTVQPVLAGIIDTTICDYDSIYVGGGWQTTGGTYIDSFTSMLGCDSVIQTNVFLSPVNVTGSNEFICPGSVAELTAPSGYTYLWSPGGSTNQTINVQAGNYNLTVTNQYGCFDTAFYTVFQPPIIDLFATPNDVMIQNNDSVTVTVSGNSSANIQTYTWSPNDNVFCLDSSTCDEVVLAPLVDTRYMLIAEDDYGCRDTTYINIDVFLDPGETMFFVPNAFTPNGDGVNDEFGVEIFGQVDFKLRIFDRWGELLYETEDPYDWWDGTYRGELMRPGVYVYYVFSTYVDNNIPENYPPEKKGSFLLLR